MAEQFRGNQRGCERGTIHTNEGTTGSLGSFVNGAGDEFLAGAGFSSNENGRVGRGNFCNAGKNGLERPRCADNFLEHRSLVDLLAEGDVFLSQSLFSLLAVFDISPGNIPARDLSLFVAQRI